MFLTDATSVLFRMALCVKSIEIAPDFKIFQAISGVTSEHLPGKDYGEVAAETADDCCEDEDEAQQPTAADH